MTEENTKTLTCRNQGCGKNYTPEENTAESCRFHCKPPYFHDAIKIWPCCDKKSYNFSDFLDIPGCTVSFHNDKADGELLYDIKNKLKPSAESIAATNEMLKKTSLNAQSKNTNIYERVPFCAESTSNVQIPVEPNQSLVTEIERLKASFNAAQLLNKVIPPPIDPNNIPVGTNCRRNGCDKEYNSKLDCNEECVYHDGVPIFHDGSKFWSCCRIKKSDFNEFLRQKGCCVGLHDFVSQIKNKMTACRFDFYQQNEVIVITFYAKLINYPKCSVICDPYHISLDFIYESDQKSFSDTIELFAEIYPQKTRAIITPFKLELRLTIVNPNIYWRYLKYQTPQS